MKIVSDFGFLEGQAFFTHDLGMNYCAARVGGLVQLNVMVFGLSLNLSLQIDHFKNQILFAVFREIFSHYHSLYCVMYTFKLYIIIKLY